MATYKVLQDIEAEDTLVGPLTLRQCIYAGIAIFGGYLSFVVISKGIPLAALVFLPMIAFGVFFAFPWSKQQSTEVWALAKIRFYLKPRKRIWNQTGTKQLVTITAPKVVRIDRTKGLTAVQVQSRLRALANTIDSRGWAVKNIDLASYNAGVHSADSDRLIDATAIPQEVPELDPANSADIFDTANNPVAHKFDMMMSQSASAQYQQLAQQTAQQAVAPAVDPQSQNVASYWHMKTIQPPAGFVAPQPAQPVTPASPAVQAAYQPGSGMLPPVQAAAVPQAATFQPPQPVVQITSPQPASQAQAVIPQNVTNVTNLSTAAASPAILELANNNDLDVATIAREAQARQAEAGEVIVDFHRS